MKRFLFLIIVIAAVAADAAAMPVPDDTLAYYLDRIPYYRGKLRSRIDSLDHILMTESPSYNSINASRRLAQLYMNINADSAWMFEKLACRQARELDNDSLELVLRMRMYSLMPSCGMVHEAIEGLDAIDKSRLSADQRREYYDAIFNTYLKTAYFYPPGEPSDNMRALALHALDSMLIYVEPEQLKYRFLQAQRFYLRGDYEMAAAGFAECMDHLEDVPALYNYCADVLTKYYNERYGFDSRAAEWLVKRVINDIRHGSPSGEAMMHLSDYYHSRGNHDLAERVHTAAGRVRTYRSDRLRFLSDEFVQEPPTRPIPRRRTPRIPIAFGVISLITLLVLTYLLWQLARKNKSLKQKAADFENKYLDEKARTNSVGTNILSVALDAAEQSRNFNLLAERKLAAAQSKDLYQSLSTGKIARQQTEAFLRAFDHAFLGAYPDFYERLNELLNEDSRLTVEPHEALTPEQRIAAFLRMGVSDSSQLAKTLGLSLNTVYTYRNRLRNRARDRANFEAALMTIE